VPKLLLTAELEVTAMEETLLKFMSLLMSKESLTHLVNNTLLITTTRLELANLLIFAKIAPGLHALSVKPAKTSAGLLTTRNITFLTTILSQELKR
jgi:hypothetical protein